MLDPDKLTINEYDLPHLLVIDDEPDVCDFVSYVAEGVGYIVTAIHSAEKFPSLYSNRFDIIVLDLSMPGIDGVELIRFLGDNRCDSKIILISGFDAGILHSAHELAKEKGLNILGSLGKPLTISSLEKLLRHDSEPWSGYSTKGSTEMPTIDELSEAIKNKELVVYYQPKIDMSTSRISGVEALVRWNHAQKGYIPPSMFIPFAEDNDLINPLTNLVIHDSFKQMANWRRDGYSFRISINLSAKTLTDLDLPDKLLSEVASHDLESSQIIFEVTETSVIKKLDESLDILTRLRMKGFGLSIDDFGTGYSSMQQLQRAPFSELKVDQSFIRNFDTDADSRAIVKSTIELARRLGMRVVAEGIETRNIWNLLVDLGCDEAQGYYMGKPMSENDLKGWLREHESEARKNINHIRQCA